MSAYSATEAQAAAEARKITAPGKQSKRLKGARRQTTERAWAKADAMAQRLHDGHGMPFDGATLTRAERDHFAAYAGTHGGDWREWPAGVFRHFSRNARKKGLRVASR